jgi:hypothetical protein
MIKLRDLINSEVALQNILKEKLPISVAWELKVFINKVSPEILSYEEIRKQKIIEFGEEIKDSPGDYRIKKEDLQIFSKEMDILLDKNIDVSVPKINIKEFKDFNISCNDIMILDWLITE